LCERHARRRHPGSGADADQGKPLGSVMLRVRFDSGTTTPTTELVERKAVNRGTAECVRAGVQAGYAGTDGLSTVLIYARLL
jgi:hypothetical protein